MRNNMEKLGAIWLSRSKETSQGEYGGSNLMRLPWESGSRFSLERQREDDRDRITGVEGPSLVYERDRTAKGALSMDAAMSDFLLFVLAFFYGQCSSAIKSTSAYEHVITPLASIDHPTFTAYQKHAAGIFTERFAGNAIEGFNIEITQGWIKANMDAVGLGKSQVDYVKATGQLATATTLTLAEYTDAQETAADGAIRADGGPDTDLVAGATDEERLANVDLVLIEQSDGTWVKATPTACTGPAGGPSEITFSGISGLAGTENYIVHYISAEADSWKTPPASNQESPLRLADASLLLNGTYDGTDVTGGFLIDADWHDFTITGANNLAVDHIPGSGKIYAGRIQRGQRILTFNLSERLRDTIMAARVDANDTFLLQLDVSGSVIETGYNYGFKMIVPKVGILGHDIEVKDKLLAQKGDLIALEDPTYGIGNVVGHNEIASYI